MADIGMVRSIMKDNRKILNLACSLVLATVLLVVAGCDVDGDKERRVMIEQAKPLLNQIDSEYYSLPSAGYKKISMECKVQMVDSFVSEIKDKYTRDQMNQMRIFVDWDQSVGFKFRTQQLPEFPDPTHGKKLRSLMTAARDRVVGTFATLTVIFYEFSLNAERDLINFSKTDKDWVFEFKGRRRHEVVKFFFDHDLTLYRSEQTKKGQLALVIEYSFEGKDGKRYLSKLDADDRIKNLKAIFEVKYHKFDEIMAPSHIDVSMAVKDSTVTDEITVLDARVPSR